MKMTMTAVATKQRVMNPLCAGNCERYRLLQDHVRAAAHADPTSPTGAAVRDWHETLGLTQKSINVDNIIAQSDQEAIPGENHLSIIDIPRSHVRIRLPNPRGLKRL
jgi:hypothetical protein